MPVRLRSFRHKGPRPDDLGPAGAFDELFWSHQGATINKWLHYPEVYDRYFGPFRGRPIRFLEIGVFKGGF